MSTTTTPPQPTSEFLWRTAPQAAVAVDEQRIRGEGPKQERSPR